MQPSPMRGLPPPAARLAPRRAGDQQLGRDRVGDGQPPAVWSATSISRTASARRNATRQIRRRVLMRRLVLARSTVVLPSRNLRADRHDVWRLTRAACAMLPNGIDLDRFAVARPQRRPASTGHRHRRGTTGRKEPAAPAARFPACRRHDAGAAGDRRRRAGAVRAGALAE